MENYKEKYKDALERASKLRVQNPFDTVGQMVEHIFPELKENEDEKIRKELIAIYSVGAKVNAKTGDIPDRDIVAWLEKQDFHYSFEIKAGHWYKCVCDYMLNGSHLMFKNDRLYYCRRDWRLEGEIDERNVKNIGVNGYKSFFRPATNQEIKDWLEKQGEQTHAELSQQEVTKTSDQELSDKIEPKFKAGDWIVINETTYQIIEIDNSHVALSFNGRECNFGLDVFNNARLWTIEDAKDGDVLCYKDEISLYKHDIKNCTKQETTFGGFVYYCCYYGKRFITDSLYSLTEQDKSDIHPATKEQRDTLFAKMADAGYEWDANKKELKKMEVVSKESEDERIREQLCDFLRDNMLYQDAQYFISWLEGKKKSADEVMKIRRKAYSDGYKHGQYNIAISLGKESIEALEHFVRSIGESGYASPYDNRTKLVYRLLEQLKKIVNFIHC